MAEVATGAPSTAASVTAPSTANTTAAPAQSIAPSTTAAPTTETVNPGAWMAGFNDDLKGYVTTKGFKDPSALADAYRNFEKLQGVPQDRIMKLPDKFSDDSGAMTPEARAIFERLGAPKDANGYELERFLPKENGDPKLMETFANLFSEAGVPKGAAEKLVKGWNSYNEAQVAARKEAQVAAFKDSDAALRKDWGAAYDQNLGLAKQGMNRLGHDTKTVDALAAVLGHAGAVKFYHQMGTAVGESAFVSGRTAAPTILEPSSAKAQITALRSDRGFMEKFMAGDRQTIEMWTKLHQQAAPGEFTI